MDQQPAQPEVTHAIGAGFQALAALQAIVAGTAQSIGADFFRLLVRNLSVATGVPGAFVAEFCDDRRRVRALALWKFDHFEDGAEWDLAESPCESVLNGGVCHFPSGVEKQFPKEQGIDSYLGVPLANAQGEILGHLGIFDVKPMPERPELLATFHIFAARAASELSRLRMEQQLRESEIRFRDLFHEAPIAYVHEGLDTRFISANRAALRILGVRPEDVPQTYGRSLVADTPDNQQRLMDAFASVGRGADTSGVVLELRRKDNGQPVWIQWWSKPDPGGRSTRTMFIDITDKVLMERAQARLQAENLYLQEEIKSVHNFEEIVGRSPGLTSVLENVRRVAGTDSSVLIRGETGSGKELIARAIHSSSRRHDKPLIKVNCAALPTGLVESELFGHEKGAFTGALTRRPGRFELADGGTLFLDEIGELPLEIQAKLLRVLQEREFERLGGTTTIKVDVRIIAATNRDLLRSVGDKTFREDLYYRLNVFPVQLPPLRERTEDIPLLVRFLMAKYCARIGKSVKQISQISMSRLLSYRWPGNVRELENVIERAVILTDGDTLEIPPEMLPGLAEAAPQQEPGNSRTASQSGHNQPLARATTTGQCENLNPAASSGSLEDVERRHILSVLDRANWVIEGPRGAARVLNLHPNTLRSRMKKLGLTRPQPPESPRSV